MNKGIGYSKKEIETFSNRVLNIVNNANENLLLNKRSIDRVSLPQYLGDLFSFVKNLEDRVFMLECHIKTLENKNAVNIR